MRGKNFTRRLMTALGGVALVVAVWTAPVDAQDAPATSEARPSATAVPAPEVPLDKSYEAAFQRRAQFYIRQMAERDPNAMLEWFHTNPYFANAGGDPHKYAMPPIIARLYMDPGDEEALDLYRYLMRVDTNKGDRGLYHFSAFQRTRMFFQMRDQLPRDVIESNEYDVWNHFSAMRGNPQSMHFGTENHTYMHRASGYLWAEYFEGERPDSKFHEDWKFLRDWMKYSINRLYTIGQGEYDSSTYVGFSMASLANVHDFSEEPNMVKLSRAGIDWMATALARKYFHGAQLGPEARGFARQAVGNIDEQPTFPGTGDLKYEAVGAHSDWVCWLLFDHSAKGVYMDRQGASVDRFPTLNLAMSTYRPHPVIRNIAAKDVPLPYEARGSHPAYYGQQGNKDQDYLYFAKQFAMGTLYSPEKGVRTSGTILPQTTMFKLLAVADNGVAAFGASNGYHGHFPLEGRTPYDQYHQKRAAAINVTYVPDEETARIKHRGIFGYPVHAGEPDERGGWYFWKVNKAYVAARPLNGTAEGGTPTTEQNGGAAEVDEPDYHWLISPGQLGGWVIQAGQQPKYETLGHFQQAVLQDTELDLSDFESDRTVSYTSLQGDTIKIRHTGGPGGKPEAWTNGEKLSYENWPVFDSPYVKQELGSKVLKLNDGQRSLTIDLTGDWPEWSEGTVEQQ
ncbi:MAG: hypothetical protein ACOC93_05600 [Planctomycetota bacterium]